MNFREAPAAQERLKTEAMPIWSILQCLFHLRMQPFMMGMMGCFFLIAANSKVRHCEVWGKTPCLPSTNPSGVMTDMKMMVLDISGTGERLLIFDHSAITQL